MDQYESWLNGIITKRPLEILQVLCDLLDAGIRNGYCSTNDIQARSWSKPQVVGATFKLLNNLGFKQLDKRIDSTTKSSHGRKIHIWELEFRCKAEQAKAQVGMALVKTENTGQGLLQI